METVDFYASFPKIIYVKYQNYLLHGLNTIPTIVFTHITVNTDIHIFHTFRLVTDSQF